MVAKIGQKTIIYKICLISLNKSFLTVLLLSTLTFIGKTVAFFDFTSDFALCDIPINLYAGQSRNLRSPYWPAGSSCRYRIQAPIDYQIQVTCNIGMTDVSFFK